MAEVKISALPAATALLGSEVIPVVQGGVTRRADVNALAMGATWVQSTDPTGAVDTATAVDSAITAAGEKATLIFRAGVYRLRAKSIQPLNGQRLIFAPGAVLRPDPYISASDSGIVSNINRGAIELLHKTDVTIEGGTIEGQRGTYNAGQLFGVNILGNCRRVTVRGMFVKDIPSTGAGISYGDGIYVGQGDGTLRGIPEDILIEGNTVENCGRQNITVTHGRRVRVIGNSSNRAYSSGIDIEPNYAGDACEDIIVEGNTFFDNGQGINISADNNNYSGALIVQGNSIRRTTVGANLEAIACRALGAQITNNRISNGWHGITITGAASGIPAEEKWGRHSVVSGNVIEGCKFGVRFSANWVMVTGNSIRNCTDHGIVVDGSVADAVDSIVTSNELADCNDPATATAGNEACLLLATSPTRITVVANSIVDTRTGTARARYGIQVTATAANEHLTHNIFANNIQNMQLAAINEPSGFNRQSLATPQHFVGATTFRETTTVRKNGTGIFQVLAGASAPTSMQVGRNSVDMSIAVANGGGQFLDTIAAGDGAILAEGATNHVRIGANGTTNISAGKTTLGFYGAVPVARGAAIAAADGTLADITTKFNALLTYLRSRGDIAT